jgi:hypothetical protein
MPMSVHERRIVRSVGKMTLAAASTLLLFSFCGAENASQPETDPVTTVSPESPGADAFVTKLANSGVKLPLTFTYYFYWYDAETGLHLGPDDPLPTKPARVPLTNYRSVDWHRRQLADMNQALIDVALPVYWGENPAEPWSSLGLDVLVEARRTMVVAGQSAPTIGMFYDTSIIRGADLTTEMGMATFFGHIRSFYRRIPQEHRALVDGRPVVWLFLPQDNKYDQKVFDYTVAHFQNEFGVAPFLVREAGWKGVTTDASYVWGAAQNGVRATDLAVSVGPGYDERQVPGRSGVYRARQDGRWYRRNLEAALVANRPLLAVETWNELHEASGIGETIEYGRDYIDLTRELIGARRGEPG